MIKRVYISAFRRLIAIILMLLIVLVLKNYKENKSTLSELPLQLHTTISDKYTSADDLNSKLIDIKDFHFLINSENKCNECFNDTFVVIVISSSLENVKHRQAIRKTWGQSTDCVKILYFVGASDDEKRTQMIREESLKYQDIIQGSFKDTYRNLTYKHAMELKWVTLYCQQAKYVVKTDDDIVVRVDVLYDKLKKDYFGSTNLIACTVQGNRMVLRDTQFKWAVSKEEYSEDVYPIYCNGPFIIYSADVARRLLEESYKVRFFWIEDVHFTGTLAKRIGVNHTNLISTWYLYNTDRLYSKGPKFVEPFIYGPISLTIADIYKIWNALQGKMTVTEIVSKATETEGRDEEGGPCDPRHGACLTLRDKPSH